MGRGTEGIPNRLAMEPAEQITLERVGSPGRTTSARRQEQGATRGCQWAGANYDPRQAVGLTSTDSECRMEVNSQC